MQYVPGVDRQQGGGAPQQHRHQVQGHCPQHDLVAPDIVQPLPHHGHPGAGLALGLGRGADQADRQGGDEIEAGGGAIGGGRRRGDQGPAQPRAEDRARLPGQRTQGDGPGQDRPRHQHGRDGRHRRRLERANGAKGGGDREDRPKGRMRHQRDPDQQPHAQDLAGEAGHIDLLAIEMIGHGAGHQGQGEQGEELGQTDQADHEGALRHAQAVPGDVIDLPAEGHALDHDAQGGGEAGGPEQGIVSMSEHPVGFRGGGCLDHEPTDWPDGRGFAIR